MCRGIQGTPVRAGGGGVEEMDLFCGAGAPSGEEMVLASPRSLLEVPKIRGRKQAAGSWGR